MFYRRVREVEFVGGPLDGYRQGIRLSKKHRRGVIAIPVNNNMYRMLEGIPRESELPASSFAFYELQKHKGDYRYRFVAAKSPKELDLQNHSI
tara:strand:+ start:24888 stop:25166 length:279 start_codon:yes stop_codon:yes gene_type:complete